MALPLETNRIQDEWTRRALEQIGLAFPLTLANQATGINGNAAAAFAANRAAAQNAATGAVVQFDTEEWDVSGYFDTVTNIGRYTPLIAGYYDFDWAVGTGGALALDQWCRASLFKNGALHRKGQPTWQRATIAAATTGSAQAQANGTTDFFTIVIEHNLAGNLGLATGPTETYFQGHLIGRS